MDEAQATRENLLFLKSLTLRFLELLDDTTASRAEYIYVLSFQAVSSVTEVLSSSAGKLITKIRESAWRTPAKALPCDYKWVKS